MLLVVAISIAIIEWLNTLPWPLWQTSVAIFVVAWIGQFVGHAVEGKRPSFFRDVQFLLIGPLWILADLHTGDLESDFRIRTPAISLVTEQKYSPTSASRVRGS